MSRSHDSSSQETEPFVKSYLLDALLENVPDHVYFKDRDSRFIAVSRSLANWIGLKDPAEAIGRTDFDIFTEEHARQAYEDEQRIIQTGEPLVGIEEKETWPDGHETWVSTTKMPLRDEKGEIAGTFGISRDITRQKQVEEERARLWRALEHRNAQLQAVAEISLMTSGTLDPEELSRQAVELIRDRFNLYYVGLFLVEEAETVDAVAGRWAYLQAGTGEAGRELKRQRYRLEAGGNSMVGQCIATGQVLSMSDLDEGVPHFVNPLLPETRSELALPLISRNKTIGALTVQSTEKAAFTPEDISIFQTMARQLANAIENARLFKQAQETLEEITAIQRRYVREGWSRYLEPKK